MAKRKGPFDANPYDLAQGTTYFVEVSQFTSGAQFAGLLLTFWNLSMIAVVIMIGFTTLSGLLAGFAWVAINQALGTWVLVGRRRIFIPRKVEGE